MLSYSYVFFLVPSHVQYTWVYDLQLILLWWIYSLCRYGKRVSQTFLTSFVEKIKKIYNSTYKFITKIDSVIYLMILVMFYKH